jgi:hypothetical protein
MLSAKMSHSGIRYFFKQRFQHHLLLCHRHRPECVRPDGPFARIPVIAESWPPHHPLNPVSLRLAVLAAPHNTTEISVTARSHEQILHNLLPPGASCQDPHLYRIMAEVAGHREAELPLNHAARQARRVAGITTAQNHLLPHRLGLAPCPVP